MKCHNGIRARLWAWSLDVREDESALKNYVIRDSDCDGIFDEVYGLDAELHVPNRLKQGPGSIAILASTEICLHIDRHPDSS